MEGFQLWLNLAAKDKMCAPWYRDIPNDEIPEYRAGGLTVRVIAGESHGVAGAMQREVTRPVYLDVHLAAGTRFEQPLPAGHNAFIYVYRAAVTVGDTEVATQRMAILANGADRDGVVVQAGGDPARLILAAGAPLNEPIAQYGPFVMNTQTELAQAVEDFRSGRLA